MQTKKNQHRNPVSYSFVLFDYHHSIDVHFILSQPYGVLPFRVCLVHWDKHLNADSFIDWMICLNSQN